MAKHYAPRGHHTSSRRRRSAGISARTLVPLILVIVAAVGVVAAILLLPMGQAPYDDLATSPSSVTTTATQPANTSDATTTTTTTAATTTTTQPAVTELYLDEDGMLQFPTAGRYVQADSYAEGEEIPWELMLVNDWNPLPEGYEDTVEYTQIHLYYRRLDSLKADSRMQEALNAMLAAGQAAGISDLAVQSAYRSVSTQDRLYKAEVEEHRATTDSELAAQQSAGTVVKRPGYSEHHLGLAVDLGGNGNFNLEQDFENTEAFVWLSEHCHEYGFILRFPKDKEDITGVIYEPWHYRYVGVEAATAIMEGGLCLEEYLAQNEL